MHSSLPAQGWSTFEGELEFGQTLFTIFHIKGLDGMENDISARSR